MKSLVVSLIIVLGQVYAQAGQAKNWVCSYGDYYISLATTEGGQSLQFSICEFAVCSFQHLKQSANLKSQSSGKYIYEATDFNGIEELNLSYLKDGALEDVDVKVKGSSIQPFNNCTVY